MIISDDNNNQWALDVTAVALSDQLTVAETLSQSQVIYTTTNTTTPLFDNAMIMPGTHIAGVGSYTPEMQDVPARTVDTCKVLMDTPEARSVGDLKHLAAQHPVTLLGRASQFHSQDSWFEPPSNPQIHQCTFYKSVGTAIQDVMTAKIVVDRAQELGIGVHVDMS